MTETAVGNVDGDSCRVIAVTWNPAESSAAVMGAPKLPAAWSGQLGVISF